MSEYVDKCVGCGEEVRLYLQGESYRAVRVESDRWFPVWSENLCPWPNYIHRAPYPAELLTEASAGLLELERELR